MQNSPDNGSRERIWKIREIIQDLENIKDQIIQYLDSKLKLDASKEMWISDAKAFYYEMVATWTMLNAALEKKEEYSDASNDFLEAAKNSLSRSMSELKSFNEEEALKLESRATEIFKKCWDSISLELEKISPKKEYKPPTKKVIKMSDIEYRLPCSVCGEISVIFKIGTDQYTKEESLIYTGITHQNYIKLEYAKTFLNLLENENLIEVHSLIQKIWEIEGMDAYCPECNKIYCRKHYNAIEEYDDGFYDDTYGTCPNGHKRMIDD